MDTPKYVQLGEGVYADPSDEHIMVINPVEMLKAQDIEVTQESVFAVYADALKGAAEEGIEVILITEEGIPSTAELIAEQFGSTDSEPTDEVCDICGEPGKHVHRPLDVIEEEEQPDGSTIEESEPVDTTVMITSDEYTGPERRRMPRR